MDTLKRTKEQIHEDAANKRVLVFLKAYIKWVDKGASVDHTIFTSRTGLCTMFQTWGLYRNKNIAMCDLKKHLPWTVNRSLPFNPTPMHYGDECKGDFTHLNPQRINWVKQTIKQLEKDHA